MFKEENMLNNFQELFVSPHNKNKLHYNGTYENKKWLNGSLVELDKNIGYKVVNGIPCFVDSKDDPWSDYDKLEEVLGASPDGMIEKNWLGMIQNDYFIKKAQRLISMSAEQEGLILEIGCGPGGGLSSLVLNRNPNSKILLNDYGLWILSETQNFVQKTNKWKNISYAQFDASKMPLCDDSFNIVQSLGGFSNMKSSDKVLDECYRILKPKGKLCFIDAVINKNQFENLPDKVVQKWYSDRPFLRIGFEKLLSSHLFKNIQIEIVEKRQLRKDEGNLAAEASKYNVVLDIELSSIIAEK